MAKDVVPRAEVYEAIDTERTYQIGKWGTNYPDESVKDFVNYSEKYLGAAKEHAAQGNDPAALDDLRKVAGLAVACMERHGAPERGEEVGEGASISGPTTRADVYKALDSERSYQSEKWGTDYPEESVADFIKYTEKYLHAAKEHADQGNELGALDDFRKVGGLAVACMEKHGAPMRVTEKASEGAKEGAKVESHLIAGGGETHAAPSEGEGMKH